MRGSHNRRTVPFRRKREQRTDYKQRLRLLLSQRPRLVVRRSLKHIQAQIVAFDTKGDKILVTAHSRELAKQGYTGATGNMPAAYLTGLLLAKKAKEKKIEGGIADLGLSTIKHGSRLFAVVKGAKQGGLDIPSDDKALPADERVSGAHVADYAKKLKADDEAGYKRQFAAYLKNKADPTALPAMVEATKKKIIG